jgi:hypothetical protein
MKSLFKIRSRKQKRLPKTQFATLTAVLMVVLVALPVSADYYDQIEYTAAYEEASASSVDGIDAGSARMAALGEYFAAQRLEASSIASSARYTGLAALYGHAGGAASGQDAEMLAKNPELKYAAGSAGAAANSSNSDNPELSAFQRHCSC